MPAKAAGLPLFFIFSPVSGHRMLGVQLDERVSALMLG